VVKRRRIPTLDFLETRNLMSVGSLGTPTIVGVKTTASLVSSPGVAGATNVLANLNSTLAASLANGASLVDTVTENISITVSMSGVISYHTAVSSSLQATPTSGGPTKTNVLANFNDTLLTHLTPGSSLNETVTETIAISVSMSGVVSDHVTVDSSLHVVTGVRPVYANNTVTFHMFQNQVSLNVNAYGDGWNVIYGDPQG